MSPARVVDEPESGCEWCRALLDEPCEDDCDCPTCEGERAAQDDYDGHVERCSD